MGGGKLAGLGDNLMVKLTASESGGNLLIWLFIYCRLIFMP